jgi:hypothetical protein
MTSRLRSAAWATYLALLSTAPVFGQPPTTLPPIKTVGYDHRGVFHVNGKPFFPIALYDAPLDDSTLRELRDFGFNVLACDGKACAALPARGFYGAAHADKKIDDVTGVFMGVGMDSPALNFKKDLLKQVAEANARTSAAVPGRPIMNAIGYWEDEPAGVIAGKLPSKAVYEDLVAAIDVSAPYLYPVPYQPISSVGDAVARARKGSDGKKPILPVLQIFVWEAKDRYPTPAELRCMAFLCLVEGAHGIGYYSYGSVTGRPKTTIAAAQPELWKSVKKLNHDIAEIGPQLLSGTEGKDLTIGKDTPAVKMKLVHAKGGALAVVVNSAATRAEVKLTWQARPVGPVVLQNGKQIELKEGVATLPLEAFGVEILRWARTE